MLNCRAAVALVGSTGCEACPPTKQTCSRGTGLLGSAFRVPCAQPGTRQLRSARDVATAFASGGHSSHAVAASSQEGLCTTVEMGFPRLDRSAWEVGKQLGKGGNAQVHLITELATKDKYAVKICAKVLQEGSDVKRKTYLTQLQREVQMLQRLSGSLNVCQLKAVFEDDTNLYIVQELCEGGELVHAIGAKHYSERTVASYMRAVLRTIAQCHAHQVLHRDIKPGNFMLLSCDERSPLRAIDFGLAVPFEPDQLPLTNLGLEGTPWFQAPEVLSSQVLPASDVWSAGIMCHQLLTGRLPFDDHRNPNNPSITAIWRSILNDSLAFDKPWWADISEDAKDFVRQLCDRDPSKRPTAKEALQHPWLRGDTSDRSCGKRLQQSVVARIQRFASASVFKRSVLQMMTAELLAQGDAQAAADSDVCEVDASGHQAVVPDVSRLGPLLTRLKLDQEQINTAEVGQALQGLGFRLTDTEVARLLTQLDVSGSGTLQRATVAASLLDWRQVQQQLGPGWEALALKVFQALDQDKDGVLVAEDVGMMCRSYMSDPALVEAAVEQAMEDASHAGAQAQGVLFEDFLGMLRVRSGLDSLDIYDQRLPNSGSSSWARLSVGALNALLHRTHSASTLAPSPGGSWARGLASATSLSTGADASQHPDCSAHAAPSSRHRQAAGALCSGAPDSSSCHTTHHGTAEPAVFDMDMSMHPPRAAGPAADAVLGSTGVKGCGEPAGATAAAAPARPAWRFDVAGQGQQGSGRVPAGAPASVVAPSSPATGCHAPVAVPPPPTSSCPAATVPTYGFRFDVTGPVRPSQERASVPKPQPSPQWRFDVAGPARSTPLPMSAVRTLPAHAADPEQLAPKDNQLRQHAPGLHALVQRGCRGMLDERQHGGMMYKNAAKC
ncbi:hypothetical protein QJQ45_022363 [Haematococcus lacustris]|nr:hypothetical protein QJQ45_022363 [Haematococcus lacustris]